MKLKKKTCFKIIHRKKSQNKQKKLGIFRNAKKKEKNLLKTESKSLKSFLEI